MCKNLQKCYTIQKHRLHTCFFHIESITPLRIALSHCRVTDQNIPASVWPHINNLMHYLQTSSPLSHITLSQCTILHPDANTSSECTVGGAQQDVCVCVLLTHCVWVHDLGMSFSITPDVFDVGSVLCFKMIGRFRRRAHADGGITSFKAVKHLP